MRALITGAAGFAGSHLGDQLLADGWEVHGTSLVGNGCIDGIAVHTLDLRDATAVEAMVRAVQPDRVFHLAAQASVAAAWADPIATLTDNIVMTQTILDAIRLAAPRARVLIVGSSEEYGMVDPMHMPVVEEEPIRPVDPYGVSKASASILALQHVLAFGTHVVRVRPFNHIGPRQRRGFVLADFAAGLVAIERGEAPPVLRVGNLHAARDFTDVRDVTRAYRVALEHGTPGAVYNVCSGGTVRIADLLDALIGATAVPVRIESDPSRTRPIDRPATIGSYQALHTATGWEPRIPLAQTVADTLAFWRAA